MFVATPTAASPDFAGKTLVLPAVSFGNVGQLAVDVLVSTALGRALGPPGATARRAGEFVSRHVLPVVGADAFQGEPGPHKGRRSCTRSWAVFCRRRPSLVRSASLPLFFSFSLFRCLPAFSFLEREGGALLASKEQRTWRERERERERANDGR